MDVVVTLQTENFSRDFSLPANVKLSQLYPRLLGALQSVGGTRFADWTGVILESEEGAFTDPEATLSEYGVCTGMYLYLAEEDRSDGD